MQIVECIKSNKLSGSSSKATQQRTTVIQPDGVVKSDRFWGYKILLQYMPEDVASAVRLHLSRDISTSSEVMFAESSETTDQGSDDECGSAAALVAATSAAAAAASKAATQAAIDGALVQPPDKRRKLEKLFATLEDSNKVQMASGNVENVAGDYTSWQMASGNVQMLVHRKIKHIDMGTIRSQQEAHGVHYGSHQTEDGYKTHSKRKHVPLHDFERCFWLTVGLFVYCPALSRCAVISHQSTAAMRALQGAVRTGRNITPHAIVAQTALQTALCSQPNRGGQARR